jgi:RND family efflux transporter MFP subunit
VQTIATVSIKSRIDGYIDRVLVHDGQFVKTGEVVFELDRRLAEAHLQQARAQLDRDKASLEGAERDLRRNTDLVAKDAGPVMNLDAVKTQVGIFQGDVRSEEAAIELKVQLSSCSISAPIDGRVGWLPSRKATASKPTTFRARPSTRCSQFTFYIAYIAFSPPRSTFRPGAAPDNRNNTVSFYLQS